MDDNKERIESRKDEEILIPAASAAEAEPLPAHAEAAEALLKSVNDTAGNARNVLATYILLSVYIFLTVGATNDEQLLRDSGIAVPFLSNINLPVSRFYLFVPWMFLFAHVDLLLLFKLMADKLHAFNAELEHLPNFDKKELRLQLSGLPFVHWLSGDLGDGFNHLITGWVVWASLFLLPLLSLLALQIGFLPYHSAAATFLHKTALGLDVLALWFFWPRLVQRLEEATWRWWSFVDASAQTVCRYGCLTVLAVALGSSVLLLSLPDSQLENLQDDWTVRHWLLDANPIWQLSAKEIQQAANLPEWSFQRIEISLRSNEEFVLGVAAYLPIFHRNLDLHEKLLVANNPELKTLDELQKPLTLPGEANNPLGISLENRNAVLVNIKGLDLQNRDLRFANLSKAKLWKADLRGAQLQHSNLSDAQLAGMLHNKTSQLQGANLHFVHLEGEDLAGIHFQGAFLFAANLQGAYLREAHLQGAVLGEASLQGADLHEAYLQGAVLVKASLQGADLRKASLQGADLREVGMQGAYLRETRLQSADLRGGSLQGTDLHYAYLQGADLHQASLQGANLYRANLQGASLRGVQAGSADFEEADLQGNDVSGMQLTPAYTQADFNIWKNNARERLKKLLRSDELDRREKWLASRVGQAPVFPKQGFVQPCLADAKLQSHPGFQSCQTPAKDFFMALASFLGELACSAQSDTEGQPYIAQGIARRALNADEWDKTGQAARSKLAQRLLQPDCAGKASLAHLSDDARNDLRKLAGAR